MKFQIEIAGPRNEQQFFSPAQLRVRGRWHVANVSTREQSVAMRALNHITEIPGQIIELDTEKRMGAIRDPLNTTKGRELLDAMNKVFVEHQEAHGGAKSIEKDREFPRLTVDQVKTWMHHMRAIVDNDMGRKATGSQDLPSLEKIATMPGKRMLDPGNTGLKNKDLVSMTFVDEVPVSAKG